MLDLLIGGALALFGGGGGGGAPAVNPDQVEQDDYLRALNGLNSGYATQNGQLQQLLRQSRSNANQAILAMIRGDGQARQASGGGPAVLSDQAYWSSVGILGSGAGSAGSPGKALEFLGNPVEPYRRLNDELFGSSSS
jgi:hypothetical protein